MAAPSSTAEFLEMLRKSGVADEKRLSAHLHKLRTGGEFPNDTGKLAGLLVRDGLITAFQAENILAGRWRRFTIGKYKVLERIGSGGMGQVFLCEHKLMRRRVAVKVLPTSKAEDESALARFYREARAVAALDHPNIVHAYDIDQDDKLHFLVMEYVDGPNLQDLVKKHGVLDVVRACHYVRQSALGLQHANEGGLVHRDIKPGNILVDRSGCVKVLDMGLARFFSDEDDVLTKKFDENVLGTADYLAPEQAIDSHTVDVRADIYSLGATFYFLLTGKPPFGDGSVAQKLLAHANKQPRPIAELRKGVPAEIEAIILKMMAKQPAERFQKPGEVAAALEPFTREALPPPPATEMPTLSPASIGYVACEPATAVTTGTPPPSPQPMPKQAVPPQPAPPQPVPPPVLLPVPERGNPKIPASAPLPRELSPAATIISPPAEPTRATAATSAVATAPAPARAIPQPKSASAEVSVVQHEEIAPWDAIASDTADLTAQGDTAPKSILQKEKATQERERRRLRIVIAAISVPVVIALIALLIYSLTRSNNTGPAVRGALIVTREPSGSNQFKSIRAALSSALPKDVIYIDDEEHVESVEVERPMDVTLQAAPGKKVVWKSGNGRSILLLSKAQGFKLKGEGITLDGALAKGRVADLVTIMFQCPGLTIEDLHLENFANSGIHMTNVVGDESRPVRLVNITGSATGASAGILLDASADVMNLPPYNDFVEIDRCTFQGIPPASAVKAKEPGMIGKNVKLPKPEVK